MIYTSSVSLFDKIENNDSYDIARYIIEGVYLERSIGSYLSSDGEKKNYNATLFVPYNYKSEDTYVKPKLWESLSSDDKLKNFTFREGQLISLYTGDIKLNTLDAIVNSIDDTFRVISVEYLDGVLPHFEILCK